MAFFEVRDGFEGISTFFAFSGLAVFSGAFSVVLELLVVCPGFLLDAK